MKRLSFTQQTYTLNDVFNFVLMHFIVTETMVLSSTILGKHKTGRRPEAAKIKTGRRPEAAKITRWCFPFGARVPEKMEPFLAIHRKAN